MSISFFSSTKGHEGTRRGDFLKSVPFCAILSRFCPHAGVGSGGDGVLSLGKGRHAGLPLRLRRLGKGGHKAGPTMLAGGPGQTRRSAPTMGSADLRFLFLRLYSYGGDGLCGVARGWCQGMGEGHAVLEQGYHKGHTKKAGRSGAVMRSRGAQPCAPTVFPGGDSLIG